MGFDTDRLARRLIKGVIEINCDHLEHHDKLLSGERFKFVLVGVFEGVFYLGYAGET